MSNDASPNMTSYDRALGLAGPNPEAGTLFALLAVADELRLLREALGATEVEVQPVDPREARGIRPGQGVQESLERRGW